MCLSKIFNARENIFEILGMKHFNEDFMFRKIYADNANWRRIKGLLKGWAYDRLNG